MANSTECRPTKLRRLDSVSEHTSALDKFFADELQGQVDLLKDGSMKAKFLEAFKDHPEKLTQDVLTDFAKELQKDVHLKLAVRQRDNATKVWAEYDKNNDGSLSPKEIEKLLTDLVKLEQKNLPDLIDQCISGSRDITMAASKLAVKGQVIGVVKASQPQLQGTELDSAVDAFMEKQGVTDKDLAMTLDLRMAMLKPAFVAGVKKCLDGIAADIENMAKTMAEEMDTNHDGKVDKDEFADHYYDAISKVIDMDKWIEAIGSGRQP